MFMIHTTEDSAVRPGAYEFGTGWGVAPGSAAKESQSAPASVNKVPSQSTECLTVRGATNVTVSVQEHHLRRQ